MKYIFILKSTRLSYWGETWGYSKYIHIPFLVLTIYASEEVKAIGMIGLGGWHSYEMDPTEVIRRLLSLANFRMGSCKLSAENST